MPTGDESLNFLLLPMGSAGDVYPFVGLGVELQRRGHQVTLATSGYFEDVCRRADLPFIDALPADEFLDLTRDPELWHPLRGFRRVFRHGGIPALRRQYQLVADHLRDGPATIVTSCLGWGARVAQDEFNAPLITCVLQPGVFWSRFQPPHVYGVITSKWVPAAIKQLQFSLGEAWFIDPVVLPAINQLRRERGLLAVSSLSGFWHSPDCVLGMFPSWFGPPAVDWPEQVQLAEFPLWDELASEPLADEIEQFLQRHQRPIVFTCGTANRFAHDFFAAAIGAVRTLDRPALFLTRFSENLPSQLPDHVMHVGYAPFSQLLTRTAAVVHHGGVGTTARAMAAGIPQLIMPLSFDQPDNAHRVTQLNVGSSIRRGRFRSQRVARELHRLINSADVGRCCRDVSGRIRTADPFARACQIVERYARGTRLREKGDHLRC